MGFVDVFKSLAMLWEHMPELLRDAIVAASSALFGAWVSGRSAAKRAMTQEVRALSAAHALCFSIANKALELKRQYLKKIKADYDELTKAHDDFMMSPTAPLDFRMDLRSLSEITFPSEPLQKITLEKLSLFPRGVAAVVYLAGTIDDLRESIRMRNNLVEEFRSKSNLVTSESISRYLGLVNDGSVDDRFRGNLEALCAQADGCIYFAKELSKVIVVIDNSMRRKNWYFFLPDKKLEPIDWTRAINEDLLPADEEFEDWERGFRKRTTFLEAACSLFKCDRPALRQHG